MHELFVETIEDLRQRCDLRASEYDMVQASGLIRRLLMDGSALWIQVNRNLRIQPVVEWAVVRTLVRAKTDEGVMLPGLALDPVIARAMLAVNFPNNDGSGVEKAVRSGNVDKFLGSQVIDRHHPDGVKQTATVRDLIKHYANREGGVHYGPGGKSTNEFIEQIRDFADEDLRRTVVACGRIILRALEPIAVAVTLKDKPWPVGLDFTYAPPEGS
jgi:hypothetical protein